MDLISFCKFHGFGNDYIVVEKDELPQISDLGDFAEKICHRHTGVGGDGVALLEKLESESEADYSCRIINPDGSEAGFSGNGTRCAVAYLHFAGKWQSESLRLQTKSGIKNYELLERSETSFRYLAELGTPAFSSREIPFESVEPLAKITDYELRLSDRALPVTILNVGNPVCVVFVEDFKFEWRRIGAEIESHERFPERTNVVFVRVLDAESIEVKIWERGAGETSSSGTCSVAAAVAAAFSGKTGRRVAVRAPGGTSEVLWRAEDGEMLIEGRAELVFRGEWFGG